jgi:hypothetical protein
MERIAAGVLGAALVVGVAAAFRLWSDISRDRVGRPTPIPLRGWKLR